jgi:hypothetical protein
MDLRFLSLASAAALLGGCGQSDNGAANQAANTAQPKKKVPYCFFKDKETKGWKASRGKDGNIIVKGKGYREDSRYQVVLGPSEASGTTVSVAPTITPNTTGFGAPDNWWDVSATIPNSGGIDTVIVTCGAKTLATLAVKTKS